jgi:uncharacterized RDD family membrane protein YckC
VSDDLTHYELLEVDPHAPKEEIRSAYQAKLANVRAARDKEAETRRPSEAVIRAARDEEARLRAAWQILSDPVQRQRYDDQFQVADDHGDGTDDTLEDPDAALVPPEPLPAPRDDTTAPVTEALEIPSTGRRLTAALIDGITLAALWAVIVYPITLGGHMTTGLPAFITEVGTAEFLILVYLILPTAWTGQTLGKRYTYCMVVDRATGQLPTIGQVIRRYIVPAFAFALLVTTGAVIALIYALSFLMNRDQISLADRLARTAVVIARYKPERLA